MQCKPFNLGPVALTNTLTTNILNPKTLTGGVGVNETKTFIILKHIRIVNKTGGAVTFTLYKGATGGNSAGTEAVGTAQSIPANSSYDWYGAMYFSTSDFLVGGASANTSLTLQAEGEIGIAD